jgi:hypothetical protein
MFFRKLIVNLDRIATYFSFRKKFVLKKWCSFVRFFDSPETLFKKLSLEISQI